MPVSGLSSLFILDARGKVLISREYRGDTPAGCVDRFVSLITGEATTPALTLVDC